MATPQAEKIGPTPAIQSRRVHYIGGFDPRGARYYHRLYREEAVKQAPLLGGKIEVGDRRKKGAEVSGWTIRGDWNGTSVTTDYQFMAWDDIVRQNWEPSRLRLLFRAVFYYLNSTLSGGFKRIRQVSEGAFYTALHPLIYFATVAEVIATAAAVGAWAAWLMTGSIWAAAGAALGLAWATGYGGLVLADFLGTTWILRSCIFTYEWGRRPPADVDTRADAMAEHILREWEARPVDEVVVVGHSSGTFVVIAVMARLVKKSGARGPAPQIKLLTLGQCIPYLSFAASATDFRRDLELVGHSRIPWVDVTAATDVMCFFRVNPLAATSYIPTAEERPKMITARFFEMFSPKAYTKLKRDMVRLHFQYMMASEKRSSFDYFELTAGPRPFEEQAWATPRRKRKSEM